MEPLTLEAARANGAFDVLVTRISDERYPDPSVNGGTFNRRLGYATRLALLRLNIKFAWQLAQTEPSPVRYGATLALKGIGRDKSGDIEWTLKEFNIPLGQRYAPDLWAELVNAMLPADLATREIEPSRFAEDMDAFPTADALREWADNIERAVHVLEYIRVMQGAAKRLDMIEPAARMWMWLAVEAHTTFVSLAMIDAKIAELVARRKTILKAFGGWGQPYGLVEDAVNAYRKNLFGPS
ncbi:MAG: hypothetical protein WCO25_02850 [Candidatus Uhrbacteria bacterium]